jgi:hypothetical protein
MAEVERPAVVNICFPFTKEHTCVKGPLTESGGFHPAEVRPGSHPILPWLG